jgi:dTMP kinase
MTGLAARLRDTGKTVFITREPGGTPLGEAVRAIFLEPKLTIAPLAEALLVNAARVQHVADAISPALARGEIVLCDRFTDSTLAYQGYGRGVDLALLERLCEAAVDGVMPDLTFVLDLPVRLSRARIGNRGKNADRIEAQDDAFHERVRDGFLRLASTSQRYRVLDGTKAPEVLVEEAMVAVNEVALAPCHPETVEGSASRAQRDDEQKDTSIR